jgi:hypothetical protein
MRRAACLLLAWLAGCGVNPLPEPPIETPRIGGVSGTGCDQCDGQLHISGTAENAEVVWIANLDQSSPPVLAPVAADGTFEALVDGQTSDELRIQARREDDRSDPIDYRIDGPAPHPFADCLQLDLELELDDTAVGETRSAVLRIEHTCPTPLTIGAIGLRAPHPSYTIGTPALPLDLAPGELLDVSIDFSPASAGLNEEVLLIQVASPEADRRAITLYGRTP